MSAIAINRMVGPVPLDVVITEQHESGLEITENAVEIGAKITDHAFTKPRRLTLEIADRNATQTWQSLRRLQESREPFDVLTGLDRYTSMLISNLSAERNSQFSGVLKATVELQEVIIVDTATTGGTASENGRGGGANAGGKNSRRAAGTSPMRSKDAATAARSAGVTARGDSATVPVPTSREAALRKVIG